MDINGFLTFVALLIAGWSILPRTEKLRLSIALNGVERAILILVLLGPIQYLLLYPAFARNGAGLSRAWNPAMPQEALLTPSESAYVLLAIVIVYVALRLRFARIGYGSIRRLRRLIEELEHEGAHGEVHALFERYMYQIAGIRMNRLPAQRLRGRLRRWTHGSPEPFSARFALHMRRRGLTVPKTYEPTRLARVQSRTAYMALAPRRALARSALRVTQICEDAATAAAEILLVTLERASFVTAVVQTRPYFGLAVLSLQTHEVEDFADSYLVAMIRNPESALYFEIRHNQNLARGFGYELPESNSLLHFLFNNAHEAERLSAWQPIGEEVIRQLKDLGKSPETDPYNDRLDDFAQGAHFQSLLWVAIRYFDIMVTSAIRQNVEWHMWLFYFYYFTEGIEQNYRPAPNVDLDSEFPTKYSFLIYEMISAMRDWIKSLDNTPVDQSNRRLESVQAEHENGNPVKSAIIAMGQCLGVIAPSQRIPASFKEYIVGIVFDLVVELLAMQTTARYGQALLNSILEAGEMSANMRHNYLGTIMACILENDNVPHFMARQSQLDEAVSRVCVEFLRRFGEERLAEHVRFDRVEGGIMLHSRRGIRYKVSREDPQPESG